MISAASSAGEASMNLSGWNRAIAASPSRSSRASDRRPADVAGEHPGPLDGVERPLERLGDRRLEEALAQPDPELAAEHLDDGAGRAAATTRREQRLEERRPWPRRPTPPRSPRTPRATSSRVGSPAGSGAWPGLGEHLADRGRDVGRAVVGAAEGVGVGAGHAQHRAGDARPSRRRSERWSASGNGRPVRKTAAIGSSSGASEAAGSRRGSPSSRTSSSSPRRARRPRSSGAWRRWYRVSADAPPALVPGSTSTAPLVVLRRHTRDNLRGLPALVPGSRGRAPDALPGRPDAPRRDRALLHDARARARHPGDGHPRPGDGPAHRVVRLQRSSTATTARRCSTSRSASTTPGATATAARRRR